MPTATSTAADFESKGGLTRPNTSARNPLPDDGSHPGGIKSESRAASSRYRWATSSESANLNKQPINVKVDAVMTVDVIEHLEPQF